jgi:putative DNA primase/helicase
VRTCLALNVERAEFGKNTKHICLLNGTVDLETGALESHAQGHELRFQLGFNFDADAKCPVYEGQLNQTFAGNVRAIETFEEFAALTLVPDLQYQKACYLVGEGGSGKSTLLRVVEEMHDPAAVSVTSLPKLEGERYLADVVMRLLCLSSDTQTDRPIFGESFVRITGGDPVATRRLYEEVRGHVQPTVRFMGSMNFNMPKFIAAPDALGRRLIFLVCGEKVASPDPRRGEALRAERPGILNRWIGALGRLRTRGRFDSPPESAELVMEFAQAHNPVEAFIVDRLEKDPTAATPISKVTDEYNFWAASVGERQTSAMLLGKALRAAGIQGGVKQIKGVNVRTVQARVVGRTKAIF